MTVIPADMNNCNIKNTCVGGVNDGIAYDPSSPCPNDQLFDATQCDCISQYGWLFVEGWTAGAAYNFNADSVTYCCGTPINKYNAVNVGDWSSGPAPTLVVYASTSWLVDGGASKTLSLGGTASFAIKPEISATSDNTPFGSTTLSAMGVEVDGTGCTRTYVNGPAVNKDGCRARGKLRFFSWAKPAGCDCSAYNLSTTAGRSSCYKHCVGYDTNVGSGNVGP